MFIDNIYEEKYNTTFDAVYSDLKMKLEKDPQFNKAELESFLQNQYTFDGQDWLGRGELKRIFNAATISACEKLLIELKEK